MTEPKEYDTLALRYGKGLDWLMEREAEGAMDEQHPGHAEYITNFRRWLGIEARLLELDSTEIAVQA